jgi:hypothetical protein
MPENVALMPARCGSKEWPHPGGRYRGGAVQIGGRERRIPAPCSAEFRSKTDARVTPTG